jgi:hypothetical protein
LEVVDVAVYELVEEFEAGVFVTWVCAFAAQKKL